MIQVFNFVTDFDYTTHRTKTMMDLVQKEGRYCSIFDGNEIVLKNLKPIFLESGGALLGLLSIIFK